MYPQGPAVSEGKPLPGLSCQAHRKTIPLALPCHSPRRRIDVDVSRFHEMEGTSQCLDNGFLDRPEQGRSFCRISARQHQGMLQFVRLEDPLKGVFFVEFIRPCHINTDIGLIPGESGPDSSATLAEGDSRPRRFPHQEVGPAKQTVCQLNGQSSSAGRLAIRPKGTSHRQKMIPQGRDE